MCNFKLFFYFSAKTYVVGTQKNHLNETVLFEHPKHMFKLMDKKITMIINSKKSAYLVLMFHLYTVELQWLEL